MFVVFVALQALCWVCAKSGVGRDRYALGLGSFLLRNIRRHQNRCSAHKLAIERWNARATCEGHSKGSETAASTKQPLEITVTKALPGFPPSHVLFLRTLLETRGSFLSLAAWTAAASSTAVGGTTPFNNHLGPKECRRGLDSMASFERGVTHRLLKAGDACWLQADGSGRTYQVAIGTVIWRFPPGLPWLLQLGTQYPGLMCLGERGPWLVERLIGAREFPGEMHTAAKVQMVVESVRRAATMPSGEADVELHRKIGSRTLCWASDGADRSVGDAATEHFPSMAFRVWEESHSSVKVLAHAVQDDPEVRLIDALLVSGKKPPSLAKFLSTSSVYRRRCGDAQQMAQGVSLCENFGWAPHRYASRARPMAREARRWGPIWDSLAAEAVSADGKRRAIARRFFQELGGQNAPRLLLGGMLTDISVEHYSWVATGDEQDPDPSTTADRAELFLSRLDVLFDKGAILTLADTYTGEVLRFLRQGRIVHYRAEALTNRPNNCSTQHNKFMDLGWSG